MGHNFINTGAAGQPRLVKTPMEPWGEEELAEVRSALGASVAPVESHYRLIQFTNGEFGIWDNTRNGDTAMRHFARREYVAFVGERFRDVLMG